MIEYILLVPAGCFAGVFTGLVPGVHPNTVIFGTMPFYFVLELDFLAYISFISGMTISHTFHDFLPAIFLGAPEPETAMASLPGHRLVRRGRGIEAFHYTVAGGLVSSVILFGLSPVFLLGLEPVYSLLEPVMEYLLLFFLLVPVIDSGDIPRALVTTLLSAALGITVFTAPVNQQYVLMPVFSGLFAVPSLLFIAHGRFDIPGQQASMVDTGSAVRGGIIGSIAGTFAGVFPGIGGAISTYILAPMMEDDDRDFMSAMGAVNTTDALMSFLTLIILGKARSGSAIVLQALSTVSYPKAFFLVGCSLVAVSISAPVALGVSRTGFFRELDLKRAALPAIGLIMVLAYHLSGAIGLLVLAVSSTIGFAAAVSSQRRLCMAVLIVPAMLFFAGIDIFI